MNAELIVASVLVFFCLMLGVPEIAYASLQEENSCLQVDIHAQANTDGSLQVTEQHTLAVGGTTTEWSWVFDSLPHGASIEVLGVRMAEVDGEGKVLGEWIDLPEEPFVLAWREEGLDSSKVKKATEAELQDGGFGMYTFDQPQNTLYALFPHTDAPVIFELDYAVIAGVRVFDDMAEINWKYVVEKQLIDYQNLSATIVLPLPSTAQVVAGENLFAWGHGPQEGRLSIRSDGTVVYEVPYIKTGQYAEARVLFPADWLSNLSAEAKAARSTENILETAFAEEQNWLDSESMARELEMRIVVGTCFVCALLLMLGLVLFFLFAWRRTAQYETGPSKPFKAELSALCDKHSPAILGRLWRYNHKSEDDLVASVMHLLNTGVISICEGSYFVPSRDGKPSGTEHSVLNKKSTELNNINNSESTSEPCTGNLLFETHGSLNKVRDFLIVINDLEAKQLSNPLDRATLELMFNTIADGAPALWAGSVLAFANKEPKDFVQSVDAWQDILSKQVEQAGLFDNQSKVVRGVFAALAFVAFAGAAITALVAHVPLVLLPALAVALALGVMALCVPKTTERGSRLIVQLRAPSVVRASGHSNASIMPQAYFEELFRTAYYSAANKAGRLAIKTAGSFGTSRPQ